ncbi:MAG: hypothetical protein HYV63_28245 [Candidatus Schekmanbacteria bacterium]|nr:hypothetical protein [Candidatus Schekmanbacteria bacterium]
MAILQRTRKKASALAAAALLSAATSVWASPPAPAYDFDFTSKPVSARSTATEEHWSASHPLGALHIPAGKRSLLPILVFPGLEASDRDYSVEVWVRGGDPRVTLDGKSATSFQGRLSRGRADLQLPVTLDQRFKSGISTIEARLTVRGEPRPERTKIHLVVANGVATPMTSRQAHQYVKSLGLPAVARAAGNASTAGELAFPFDQFAAEAARSVAPISVGSGASAAAPTVLADRTAEALPLQAPAARVPAQAPEATIDNGD